MPQPKPIPSSVPPAAAAPGHEDRLAWLEVTEGAVLALPTDYPDGHKVPLHSHSRAQLLYALTGVVMVTTDAGRWMVPPEHAIWLPAGLGHAVEMLGRVAMRSIYVRPDALPLLPDELRVVEMTPLLRNLVVEAMDLPPDPAPTSRDGLLKALLLHEIPRLPPRPLGLPLPAEPRLAVLCRASSPILPRR